MKKIFSLFLCIIFLTGCENFNNKDVKNEPLNFSGFTCTVETINNNVKICADVEYKIDGSVTISYLEPLNLNNIILTADDEVVTICQDNAVYTYPFSKAPTFIMSKTIKICGDLSKNKIPIKENDDLVLQLYENENLYKLYLDNENKEFKKLVLDSGSEIIFKNFEFLK